MSETLKLPPGKKRRRAVYPDIPTPAEKAVGIKSVDPRYPPLDPRRYGARPNKKPMI